MTTVTQQRVVSSWQEAEELAAEWMRYLGFADAEITGGSADSGLDVYCDRCRGPGEVANPVERAT